MANFISNLLSGGSKGVGIEINPDKISVAQLSKKGQQYKLLKYYSLDVPEEIFEEGRGRVCWRGSGQAGRGRVWAGAWVEVEKICRGRLGGEWEGRGEEKSEWK